MISSKRLAGQSGIVTGGASGIGRAIVESLVAAGGRWRTAVTRAFDETRI